MNVQNLIQGKVTLGSITYPLKAGTPLDASGEVSNDGDAIGLVMEDITEKPVLPDINICVGGVVNLAEAEAASGLTYTSGALQSMSGISFYGSDGTPTPDPVYSIPPASASELGGIKVGNTLIMSMSGTLDVDLEAIRAANVAECEAEDVAGCVTSINAILTALKEAGMMEADEIVEE